MSEDESDFFDALSKGPATKELTTGTSKGSLDHIFLNQNNASVEDDEGNEENDDEEEGEEEEDEVGSDDDANEEEEAQQGRPFVDIEFHREQLEMDSNKAITSLFSRKHVDEDMDDFDEDVHYPENDGKLFRFYVLPQKQNQILIYLTNEIVRARKQAEYEMGRSNDGLSPEEIRAKEYRQIVPHVPSIFATPMDKNHIYAEANTRAEVEKLAMSQGAKDLGVRIYADEILSERKRIISNREGVKKHNDYNKKYVEEVDTRVIRELLDAKIKDIIPVEEGTFVRIAKDPIYQNEIALVKKVHATSMKVDLLVVPKVDPDMFVQHVSPYYKSKYENTKKENEVEAYDTTTADEHQRMFVNEAEFHGCTKQAKRITLNDMLRMTGCSEELEMGDIYNYITETLGAKSKSEDGYKKYLQNMDFDDSGDIKAVFEKVQQKMSMADTIALTKIMDIYFNGIEFPYQKRTSMITRNGYGASRFGAGASSSRGRATTLHFEGGLLLLKDFKISSLSEEKYEPNNEEVTKLMIKFTSNPILELYFKDGCVLRGNNAKGSGIGADVDDEEEEEEVEVEDGIRMDRGRMIKQQEFNNNKRKKPIAKGEDEDDDDVAGDDNESEGKEKYSNKEEDDHGDDDEQTDETIGAVPAVAVTSGIQDRDDNEEITDNDVLGYYDEDVDAMQNNEDYGLDKGLSCCTFVRYGYLEKITEIDIRTRVCLQKCYETVYNLLSDVTLIDGCCCIVDSNIEDFNTDLFVTQEEHDEAEEREAQESIKDLVPISNGKQVILFNLHNKPNLNFARAIVVDSPLSGADTYLVTLTQRTKKTQNIGVEEIEVDRQNLINFVEEKDYVEIKAGPLTGMCGSVQKVAVNRTLGKIYLTVDLFVSGAGDDKVACDDVGNVDVVTGEITYNKDPCHVYQSILSEYPDGIMAANDIIDYTGCFTLTSDMVVKYEEEKCLNKEGFACIYYPDNQTRISKDDLVEFKPQVVRNNTKLFNGCKYGMVTAISAVSVVFLLSNDVYIKMALDPTKVDSSAQEIYQKLAETREIQRAMARGPTSFNLTKGNDFSQDSQLPFRKTTSSEATKVEIIKNRRHFAKSDEAVDANGQKIRPGCRVTVVRLDSKGPSGEKAKINIGTPGDVLYIVCNSATNSVNSDNKASIATHILYVRPSISGASQGGSITPFVIRADHVATSSGTTGLNRGSARGFIKPAKRANNYWDVEDFQVGDRVICHDPNYNYRTGHIISYDGGDTAKVDFATKKDQIEVHFLEKIKEE